MNKLKYWIFIFLFTISSCGVSTQDEINIAVDKAKQLLTDGKCDDALAALGDVAFQSKHKEYLETYASSYACKANYSTITFFNSDLSKVGSSVSSFLPSLTTFTTSDDSTSLTDTKFTDLQTAIDTLLYAGGISASSHTNREALFTSSELGDLEFFALYLSITQMGRYFYLVGNTDSTGKKGARDTIETNNCLSDYTTVNSQAARAAATGSATISPCASDSDGYSELVTAATDRKKALCQGTVLFNNFFDLLSNITISGTSVSSLADLQTALSDLCNSAGLGDVCTIKDQSTCESDISVENLELYFIAVFETMLTDA